LESRRTDMTETLVTLLLSLLVVYIVVVIKSGQHLY
jgi:hypothetical protein